MSEDIDLGGIKVPAADWEATPESIKLVVMTLLQRLEALEEKLNKNSRNSSLPPSKDGFGAKSKNKDKPKRKPLKMAKVRQKPERKVYGKEDCQKLEVYEVKPSHCKNCSYDLVGEDSQPYQHQIVDMPKIQPIVTEYRLHELECEHCGEKTRAALPEGVTAKSYGERLAAFVAFLSGESKQSHRQVSEFLKQVLGIDLSRGTINAMRAEISESIEAATAEAKEYVQRQPVLNCDETGFSQQNRDGQNPEKRKAWLWVVVAPLVIVFEMALSRGQEIAKKLIGEAFDGVVGSDRCGCYGWLENGVRQICWAHLLRDFQAMAERKGASQEIGESLLNKAYRIIHWWHRYKEGLMSREMLIQAVSLFRTRIKQELEEAAALDIGPREQTPLSKTVRTCQNLLKVEDALWSFVYKEGIEPTNNVAERALRPAVIWRGLSFGSQSEAGSQFVARMLTVNSSLKAQGRSVLDFLTESCIAVRHGTQPPSLIPETQASPMPRILIIS
jgi:transposase